MPAAATKSDLITVTEKDFAKLWTVIDAIPPDQAMTPRADGTSIKDVIAHRAHWITLFLGWYHDGQAGKPLYFPAKGYKWNDLKAYNADLRAGQSDIGWNAAKTLLSQAHSDLLVFMNATPEPDLYGGPMKGANNQWTPGRWAEAAGPSHYRSALKWIRACLREDAAA